MRAVLIGYDHANSVLWALPLERKGAQERVKKWIVDTVEESGFAVVPVTIKSDQEVAMIELNQAVNESTSNGHIERGTRKWQAQFRTMRYNLVESRVSETIDKNSAIMKWLFVHVAGILSKYSVHENGRTT